MFAAHATSQNARRLMSQLPLLQHLEVSCRWLFQAQLAASSKGRRWGCAHAHAACDSQKRLGARQSSTEHQERHVIRVTPFAIPSGLGRAVNGKPRVSHHTCRSRAAPVYTQFFVRPWAHIAPRRALAPQESVLGLCDVARPRCSTAATMLAHADTTRPLSLSSTAGLVWQSRSHRCRGRPA